MAGKSFEVKTLTLFNGYHYYNDQTASNSNNYKKDSSTQFKLPSYSTLGLYLGLLKAHDILNKVDQHPHEKSQGLKWGNVPGAAFAYSYQLNSHRI